MKGAKQNKKNKTPKQKWMEGKTEGGREGRREQSKMEVSEKGVKTGEEEGRHLRRQKIQFRVKMRDGREVGDWGQAVASVKWRGWIKEHGFIKVKAQMRGEKKAFRQA